MDVKVDKLNEEAIELLKGELEKEHSPMVPATPIINYLISKCKCDENFATRIILEKKSLKECLDYVLQEVKKKLNNRNGQIPDQEVYDIAETYYILDEVVIECTKAKVFEEMKKKANEIPQAKTNNTVTVKTKKVVKQEKDQLSLFDF
ncbi:PcfK-like family protein [Tissierella carlieri]|uniref:PcfK-like family protein n=1 Tax=Tissierella carlieri TaxID=689904 RepID=A0ABT1SEN7_9FIRM|nr:Cas9 inhibitor AcrIIA9 family protein [Tissierella carlieri]MCQ4924916.1 PcfK-like family protein [Tissierella carlieri]